MKYHKSSKSSKPLQLPDLKKLPNFSTKKLAFNNRWVVRHVQLIYVYFIYAQGPI